MSSAISTGVPPPTDIVAVPKSISRIYFTFVSAVADIVPTVLSPAVITPPEPIVNKLRLSVPPNFLSLWPVTRLNVIPPPDTY